jgi:hypothetical protein
VVWDMEMGEVQSRSPERDQAADSARYCQRLQIAREHRRGRGRAFGTRYRRLAGPPRCIGLRTILAVSMSRSMPLPPQQAVHGSA